MFQPRISKILAFFLIISICYALPAQNSSESRIERFKRLSERSERNGLAETFKGITTNGKVTPGLFKVASTGVSTKPVYHAAKEFLNSLNPQQLKKTKYPIDDDEWRKWMNQHFYIRQGIGFNEMDEHQRQAAFGLMSAALSAKGLKLTRDIMRLNHTLGELNDNNLEEYGEWLYWLTVMGEPSPTEPWGWQLDGHHVIINYFVLGDQVVMTPLFVGSEPVIAESGKFKGTAILQEEQNKGYQFLQSLSSEQQEIAILELSKEGNNNLTEAFKDNVVLDFSGIRASSFTHAQRSLLIELIMLYVDNMDEGHAKIRMEEIIAHLDDTYFSWIGGKDEHSTYYYRIHSPVILIEFDHQKPANLSHLFPDKKPNRQHIHAVVRTPNGNDYGKDLLRQHYEQHQHNKH